MAIEIIDRGNKSSHFIVDGLAAAQHPNALNSFNLLYENFSDIKRIIEIGTLNGGLSLFLCQYSSFKDIPLITYDIVKKAELNNYCDYRIKNCFENNGKEIIDLINLEGRTLLLCDGGNKVNEFNFFSDHLKTGDIIMAHDYWHSPEYVKQRGWDKFWGSEIQYHQIKDSCEKNNLIPILREEIEKSFWCCFIKNEKNN